MTREPILVQAIYEPRPCEVCKRAIAAGQLYVVNGPRHVACQPPSRLDVQRLAQAAKDTMSARCTCQPGNPDDIRHDEGCPMREDAAATDPVERLAWKLACDDGQQTYARDRGGIWRAYMASAKAELRAAFPDGIGRECVTGAIPAGPITDATEMIFVAGRAFVETSRHEQATGALAAERDALRAQLDAERGLRQATRTALGGLVVTLTAERDAARAELEGENERLRERASVYRDALEVIAAEGAWPYEPLQRLVREALADGAT